MGLLDTLGKLANPLQAASGLFNSAVSLFDGGHTERKNARSIADYQAQLNDAATEKQNDWNLQQWYRQNVYNEDMWNKQNAYNEQQRDIENAYNSPIQQVQRLREAGINPASAFGQGVAGSSTVSSNSVPQSSVLTSAPYTPADFSAAMAAGNTSFQNQVQLQNLLASTSKMFAETKKINSETDAQETANEFQRKLLQQTVELNDVNITYTGSQNNLTVQEATNARKTFELLGAQYQNLMKDIDVKNSQIANMNEDTKKKFEEKLLAVSERDLTQRKIDISHEELSLYKQQILNEVKRGHLMDAQTYAEECNAALSRSNQKLVDEQKLGVSINNGKLAIEFQNADNVDEIQRDIDKFNKQMDNKYKLVNYIIGMVSSEFDKVHNITNPLVKGATSIIK